MITTTCLYLILALMPTGIDLSAQSKDRCMFERTRPVTLQGGKYRPIRFGNTKQAFHFRGNYDAHGAKISVYITDVENYAKLINGKTFETIYGAKKVTSGQFDLALEMGNYHLVWWNESTNQTVVIEAEVCFVKSE